MPKTWIATEVESPIKDAHFVGEEKIRIISKVLYTGEKCISSKYMPNCAVDSTKLNAISIKASMNLVCNVLQLFYCLKSFIESNLLS